MNGIEQDQIVTASTRKHVSAVDIHCQKVYVALLGIKRFPKFIKRLPETIEFSDAARLYCLRFGVQFLFEWMINSVFWPELGSHFSSHHKGYGLEYNKSPGFKP